MCALEVMLVKELRGLSFGSGTDTAWGWGGDRGAEGKKRQISLPTLPLAWRFNKGKETKTKATLECYSLPF